MARAVQLGDLPGPAGIPAAQRHLPRRDGCQCAERPTGVGLVLTLPAARHRLPCASTRPGHWGALVVAWSVVDRGRLRAVRDADAAPAGLVRGTCGGVLPVAADPMV